MGYLIKRTSKNQVTLPAKVMKQYPQVEYFDLSVRDGEIVLSPTKPYQPSQALQDARRKFKELGLTEKDITEAVHWARKQKRKEQEKK